MCNEKLWVGKKMKTGSYDLVEVDIQTHCNKCNKIFEKKRLLQNEINDISLEMKVILKEYRDLAKDRSDLIEKLQLVR